MDYKQAHEALDSALKRYPASELAKAMKIGSEAIKKIMAINTLMYSVNNPTPVPQPPPASIPQPGSPMGSGVLGEFKPGDPVTWRDEWPGGIWCEWRGTYACAVRPGKGMIYNLVCRDNIRPPRDRPIQWKKADQFSMQISNSRLKHLAPITPEPKPEPEAPAEPEYGSIVYWLQTIHHGNTAYKDVFRGQYVGLDTVERVQVRSSDEEWIGVGEPGERVEVSASLLSLNEPEINAESFSG